MAESKETPDGKKSAWKLVAFPEQASWRENGRPAIALTEVVANRPNGSSLTMAAT